MKKRRWIGIDTAKEFLRKYCELKAIDYEKARMQIHGIGDDGVILCVSNPDAPEPDGLANDIETLMLPTLWIKEDENGNLYAVETEYTKKYLYGKDSHGKPHPQIRRRERNEGRY